MSFVRVLASWLDNAPNAAPEENATACDLRLFVGAENVCVHRDGAATSLADSVAVSVYGLVERLAHDWWHIFGGRAGPYRLMLRRAGFLLPDLRFYFDGGAFDVECLPYRYSGPDVSFIVGAREVLSRVDAEAVLGTFVGETIQRLKATGIGESAASRRWDRVVESRQDPDEAAFCEAAGALQVDPYRMDDATTVLIERAGRLFEGESLIEFLAGASGGAHAGGAMEWVAKVEALPRYRSRLPALGGVASAARLRAPNRPAERTWALGYRRARAARAALNLDQTARIGSVSGIAALFDSKSFKRAPHVGGLRAMIARDGTDVRVHLRDHAGGAAANAVELFAFGRAVGDAVCFPEGARAVVNDLRDASRQAAGRAFAAEFLAPIDEIRCMSRDGKDLASIADEFGVSTDVVSLQIENADRIAQACG